MKLIAQRSAVIDLDRGAMLQLIAREYPYAQFMHDIPEGDLIIEIKPVKSKRSLQQNKYMWALIREIAQAVGVSDVMELYCQFLELADVESEMIYLQFGISEQLRHQFRAMRYIGNVDVDGQSMEQWQVFLGSSRFTVAEMNTLIEIILDTAADLGIGDIAFYEDMLLGRGK